MCYVEQRKYTSHVTSQTVFAYVPRHQHSARASERDPCAGCAHVMQQAQKLTHGAHPFPSLPPLPLSSSPLPKRSDMLFAVFRQVSVAVCACQLHVYYSRARLSLVVPSVHTFVCESRVRMCSSITKHQTRREWCHYQQVMA